MAQLTVRTDEKELMDKLIRLAKRERISLNQAALRFMRKGAGISDTGQDEFHVGGSLDSFMGTWSKEDAAEFGRAVQDLRTIDESLWS